MRRNTFSCVNCLAVLLCGPFASFVRFSIGVFSSFDLFKGFVVIKTFRLPETETDSRPARQTWEPVGQGRDVKNKDAGWEERSPGFLGPGAGGGGVHRGRRAHLCATLS